MLEWLNPPDFPNVTEKSGCKYRPQDVPATETQGKLYFDSGMVALMYAPAWAHDD